MNCNKAGSEQSIQHNLDPRAVGCLLGRSAGIGKEEAAWGSGQPDVRGYGDTAGSAYTLGGNGKRDGFIWEGGGGGRVRGKVIWE